MQSLEWMRSAITVLSFTVFIGIVVWAFSPTQQSRFDTDAHIPFDHDSAE